jgi:ABC-type cobalamin/Fe3+-siderophores transport system ATPase subunit
MKLEKLQLKGFKNLTGDRNLFKLNFISNSNSTVLIGNNGSGKSNIIEVISSIFNSLYRKEIESLPFQFDLYYSINDIKYRVSKKNYIKYRKKNQRNATYTEINSDEFYELDSLPNQVIALYSGEESRLWEDYYKDYYLQHNDDVIHRRKTIDNEAKLLYINKYYWDIALLTLIISEVSIDDILNNYILDSVEFKININKLNEFKNGSYNEVVSFIDNFYFDKDGNRIEDTDTIKIEKDDFINRFNGETHKRLFNLLCVAKLPKVDDNRLINSIKLNFSNDISTSDFSEGEKKKILLKLILSILSEDNTLSLLDEPDSHIHVAHKKQIKDITESSLGEIILTTHSPTLMNIYDEQLIYLEDGKLEGKEKADILKEISGNTMSDAHQQIILNSNTDILIVEGKTDEKYIATALEKLKTLYPEFEDLQFNFLYMGGSDPENLKKLVSNFRPKENQTIIAFFDNDGAGFGCIKTAFGYAMDKVHFTPQIENGIHICLYPKKDGFTHDSFEIEDYFKIETCRDFMFDDITHFQNTKKGFKKNKFAEYCPSLDVEEFDGFKKLFELINTIKG